MVLLESIWSDKEGRYAGNDEKGEEFRIVGVPLPNSVGVYGNRKYVKKELAALTKTAKLDNSKYYLIPQCLGGFKGQKQSP